MNSLKILTASLLISVAFSAHAEETKSYKEDKNGNSVYIKKIDPKGNYSGFYNTMEQVGKSNSIFVQQERTGNNSSFSNYLKQDGDKNSYNIDQVGYGHDINARVKGSSNEVTLTQKGKNTNQHIQVSGDKNKINAISANNNNTNTVVIDGNNNSVKSVNRNYGKSNISTFVNGDGNITSINVNKVEKSTAIIFATGNKNNFSISQEGAENQNNLTAEINADHTKYDKSGKNGKSGLNNNIGSISQKGNNNDASIDFGGTAYATPYPYDQIGVSEYNVSSITQEGLYNQAQISQSGHNNNASITQSGPGFSASIVQDGSNNRASIKQQAPAAIVYFN
ncbi:MAG: hypothetical protein WCL30_01730 [Pseudomonadota bacterium]